MAARNLLDLIQALSRGRVDDMNARDRSKTVTDITSASSPAKRLPKAGQTMKVRSLPPSKQPTKELLDPMGYSSTKLSRPIESYTPTVTPTNTPLLPRKTISLEDIEGGFLLPLYGDRSSAGGILTRVGDIDLQRGYNLEGGFDFMRGPSYQADNAIWASGAGVMKPIVNKAEEIARETGRPVYGTTISMAPNALDFAKFTPRVAADLLQQSMTKKAAKGFDDELRKRKGMSSWVGILSDEVDEWLMSATPDQQKAFMRFADTDEARKNFGVTSDAIGAARYAVTDPTQFDMPSGIAGTGISELDVTKGIIDSPSVPHTTYPIQARGLYTGSLEMPMRQEDLFRDPFRAYFSPNYVTGKGAAGPLDSANATYTQKTQLRPQLVDAQLVDTYGKMLENAKKRGLLD